VKILSNGKLGKKIKEVLRNKTENFSIQEKENVNYAYLNNLLLKIDSGIIDESEDLKSKIEYVINEMPSKIHKNKISYETKHLNEISNLQTLVEEKFNLIKKGKYSKRYMVMGMSLGMPLGLPIGAAIGKKGLSLLIGMPVGMIIGIVLGAYLDKKAENENRIL
jgi:ElaB/YqjD/DUF883 family membrane-anchored ribosome-binding protein